MPKTGQESNRKRHDARSPYGFSQTNFSFTEIQWKQTRKTQTSCAHGSLFGRIGDIYSDVWKNQIGTSGSTILAKSKSTFGNCTLGSRPTAASKRSLNDNTCESINFKKSDSFSNTDEQTIDGDLTQKTLINIEHLNQKMLSQSSLKETSDSLSLSECCESNSCRDQSGYAIGKKIGKTCSHSSELVLRPSTEKSAKVANAEKSKSNNYKNIRCDNQCTTRAACIEHGIFKANGPRDSCSLLSHSVDGHEDKEPNWDKQQPANRNRKEHFSPDKPASRNGVNTSKISHTAYDIDSYGDPNFGKMVLLKPQLFQELASAYEERWKSILDSANECCLSLVLQSRVPHIEDCFMDPVEDENMEDAEHKLAVKRKFVEAMGNLQADQLPTKRRGNLPKESTLYLKKWFDQHSDHPYPSDEEKLAMSRETNIGVAQISHWFINYRKRVWKPSLSLSGAESESEVSRLMICKRPRLDENHLR